MGIAQIRPDWDVGTITLVSGSLNFTTSGSALETAAIQAGDTIMIRGFVLVIDTITGQNSGTLMEPTPAGAAGAGQKLRIRFQPDGSRYNGATADLVQLLSSGNVYEFASLQGSADKIPMFTGAGTLTLVDLAATAVSYAEQTLTAPQQAQARANIGAESVFDSKAIAQADVVPVGVNSIYINGYYNAGDGGAALYKRVASEPTHAGKIQTADGAWWELSADVANVKMFGAKGDAINDDTLSFKSATEYAKNKKIGKIYIPSSKPAYKITANQWILDASYPIIVYGDGRSSSMIYCDGAAGVSLTLGGAIYQPYPQKLLDFGFLEPSNTENIHISVSKCVFDASFLSMKGGKNAIKLDGAFSYQIENCQVNDTRGPAFYSYTDATSHNSTICSNGLFGCGVLESSPSISIKKSDAIKITKNQIEGCFAGFILYGCTSVEISGNYMEYGSGYPFYFDTDNEELSGRRCSGVVMQNNWIGYYSGSSYIEKIDGFEFNSNTIADTVIGFGPSQNSSDVNIGTNTLLGSAAINAAPWTVATLLNGWVASSTTPSYKQSTDGIVFIRGAVTRSTGSANQTIFTLPVKYRPSVDIRVPVSLSTGQTFCIIGSNGNIYVEAGGTFTGVVYTNFVFAK